MSSMSGHESGTKTILIVEDDVSLLKLIQRRLDEQGFSTSGVTSGVSALRWLENDHAKLLLLDYSLPDMRGEELIDELDRRGIQVPFIVATGNGSEMVAVEMMKRGARDYLIKGSAFLKLLPTVVEQTLNRLEQERRLARTEAELRETHEELRQQSRRQTADLADRRAENRGEIDLQLPAAGGPCRGGTDLIELVRRGVFGEVAAELSQELRQRLADITGHMQVCQALLQHVNAHRAEQLGSSLAEIGRQAAQAAAIAGRVGSLADRSPPESTAVDLGDLVRDVAAMMAADFRSAQIDVRLELGESLPPAIADRSRIGQVLIHLMRNALDAMTAVEPERRVLTIRVAVDGPHIGVAVEDRGDGISSENLPRVFERFFTTKPHALGMGLPISRSLVESCGGRLWLTAGDQRGLRVQFTLPVDQGKPDRGK